MTISLVKSPHVIDWLTIDQWQSYVEGHANRSIFHHRNWLELLHEQYGFVIRIPALVEGEIIRAAIPLLQTRNLRGKKKLISLPFTDYLPTLAEDQRAVQELCQLLQTRFRGQLDTIVVRSDESVPGLPYDSHNVRHELVTNLPLAETETAFANTIRRNLRKAERQQLDFQIRNDKAAIDIFYRLHVLTRKKLGVPVQSKTYFHRLHEKLIAQGLGFVGVVTKTDKPIAAVVLLGFNGRLVYKYAASDPAALENRPNDWLVYNAIKMSVEGGYRVFDFGITDKQQEGLRRFKSKWGAIESDIYYNYILGEPDESDDPSRALSIASAIIKRSPTAVCRILGEAFYKYSQ